MMTATEIKKQLETCSAASFDQLPYHPNLVPGGGLFKFLLPPKGSTSHKHLRLNIPDTVVVERDPKDTTRNISWWYYTDIEGHVRASCSFSNQAIVRKLSQSRSRGPLVTAVVKTPTFYEFKPPTDPVITKAAPTEDAVAAMNRRAASQHNGGCGASGKQSKRAGCVFGGNELRLLSSRQVLAVSKQLPGFPRSSSETQEKALWLPPSPKSRSSSPLDTGDDLPPSPLGRDGSPPSNSVGLDESRTPTPQRELREQLVGTENDSGGRVDTTEIPQNLETPPYVLQRFIPPTGRRACLQRACLTHDRILKVFRISATSKMDDGDGNDAEDIRMTNKHSDELARFTTSPKTVASSLHLRDAMIAPRTKDTAGGNTRVRKGLALGSDGKTDNDLAASGYISCQVSRLRGPNNKLGDSKKRTVDPSGRSQGATSLPSTVEALWNWLQGRLARPLGCLVLDFTRDDAGKLWLLQIKGFQFHPSLRNGWPLGPSIDMAPALLTPRQEQAAEARRIAAQEKIKEKEEADALSVHKGYSEMASSGAAPPDEEEPAQNKRAQDSGKEDRFRRRGVCQCCLLHIGNGEVTYHLSLRMVAWMALHMKARAPSRGSTDPHATKTAQPLFVDRISNRTLNELSRRESQVNRQEQQSKFPKGDVGTAAFRVNNPSKGGGSAKGVNRTGAGVGNSGEWLLTHPVFGTSEVDAPWPPPKQKRAKNRRQNSSSPSRELVVDLDGGGVGGGGLGLLFDPLRSTVPVCEQCFQFYQAETKLRQVVDRLAKACGVVHPSRIDDNDGDGALDVGISGRRGYLQSADDDRRAALLTRYAPNKVQQLLRLQNACASRSGIDFHSTPKSFSHPSPAATTSPLHATAHFQDNTSPIHTNGAPFLAQMESGHYGNNVVGGGVGIEETIEVVVVGRGSSRGCREEGTGENLSGGASSAQPTGLLSLSQHLRLRTSAIEKKRKDLRERLRMHRGVLSPNEAQLNPQGVGNNDRTNVNEAENIYAKVGTTAEQKRTLTSSGLEVLKVSSPKFTFTKKLGRFESDVDNSADCEKYHVEKSKKVSPEEGKQEEEEEEEEEVEEDALTLCRLMLAVHDISDLPPDLARHVKEVSISYPLFGRRHRMSEFIACTARPVLATSADIDDFLSPPAGKETSRQPPRESDAEQRNPCEQSVTTGNPRKTTLSVPIKTPMSHIFAAMIKKKELEMKKEQAESSTCNEANTRRHSSPPEWKEAPLDEEGSGATKVAATIVLKKQHVFNFLSPHTPTDDTLNHNDGEGRKYANLGKDIEVDTRGESEHEWWKVAARRKRGGWVAPVSEVFDHSGSNIGGAGGGVEGVVSRKFPFSGVGAWAHRQRFLEFTLQLTCTADGLAAISRHHNSDGSESNGGVGADRHKRDDVFGGGRETGVAGSSRGFPWTGHAAQRDVVLRGTFRVDLRDLALGEGGDATVPLIEPRLVCSLAIVPPPPSPPPQPVPQRPPARNPFPSVPGRTVASTKTKKTHRENLKETLRGEEGKQRPASVNAARPKSAKKKFGGGQHIRSRSSTGDDVGTTEVDVKGNGGFNGVNDNMTSSKSNVNSAPQSEYPIAVMVRMSVGLFRVKRPVDKQTLPDPLIYHQGVYVPCDPLDFRPADPLPVEWMASLLGSAAAPSPQSTRQTLHSRLAEQHAQLLQASRSTGAVEQHAGGDIWPLAEAKKGGANEARGERGQRKDGNKNSGGSKKSDKNAWPTDSSDQEIRREAKMVVAAVRSDRMGHSPSRAKTVLFPAASPKNEKDPTARSQRRVE